MENVLQLTFAKLELKQMELIDRLSMKHNDYVIRVIMSTVTDKFVAVNGDWELVTGFKESYCIDKTWEDIALKSQIKNVLGYMDYLKKSQNTFQKTKFDIIKKDGKILSVDWTGKYFPEINGMVLIGRVTR